MKRLSNRPELLDGPLDADFLAGNLRDLTRINRWLGGARLSRDAVAPFLVGRDNAGRGSLLDVGTGAADIPLALKGFAVTAVDIRPEIIWIARNTVRGSQIEVRHGDLAEESPKSFDIVHLSMVLHHLDPPQAVSFLTQAGRVARDAVIVNDLDRGWRWFVGAWLMTRLLTRNPYTRNDAPLSVRRAYTVPEVATMAADAGLRPVALYRARPAYRYALVLTAEPHGDD